MTYQNRSKQPNWRRHSVSKKRRKLFKKFNKQLLIKNAVLIVTALFILGSIFALGIFAWAVKDLPNPDELIDRNVIQSTKIYDSTGEHLLYEIHGDKNRTLVSLEDIPQTLIDATISVEDQQFYKHTGFNPIRIFKGVVLGQLFEGYASGGSTITQQFVKNAVLTSERTITRKIKELIISIELERRFEKNDILQMYFNEIPYGSTNYGCQSASQAYFGKSVTDLTLAEAATLAALPKAPSRYLNNPDLLDERRDLILQMMVNEGYLEQDLADAAMDVVVELQDNVSSINAPHFVLWVKQLLEEEYGERLVEQGGLKVTTSLDFEMQKIAEDVVEDKVDDLGPQLGFSNSSLVALDPKTGKILAMVGSKDYFDEDIDGAVNVALRPRQPGSSFKPIVYSAAFAEGYTPNTILWDVETTFPTATGDYSPKNYDLGERGPVTIRTALQGSLNIPAVKTVYLTGIEDALTFAEGLGYSTFADRSRFGLSVVLGGAEVKLIEHVAAYSSFANNGLYQEPVAILKVEDADGEILEEWKESKGTKAMEANIAKMITNVLSDNAARTYVFGSNNYLQLGDRPVAAKTGTTNDYRDAWLIGYTPSLAVGVWAGNNDNSEMARGAGGSTAAGPIWNAFMKQALVGTAVEYFDQPEIPITGKTILDGQLPETTVIIDTASGKLATDYTPDSYRQSITFAEYHTILHYIDRNDPTGSQPNSPDNDLMYEPWESAIQDWIVHKQGETGTTIVVGEPPTEYDDLHIPANFPDLEIVSPENGSELTSRSLKLEVDASAPRSVSRVEYYLDDLYLTTDSSAPFAITKSLPGNLSRGWHTLRATAFDDIDNSTSKEVSINIQVDPTADTFNFATPTDNQTIDPTETTFAVVLQLQQPTNYSNVTLYSETYGSGQKTIAGSVTSPTSPFVSIDWLLPETGYYFLSARASALSGTDAEALGILIYVSDYVSEPVEEEGDEGEEPEPPPDLNPFE
ncbi:MAG: PBP1A family penicillin-binding protein [Candidatus Uhrbacteria bacterium]